MLVQVRWRQGHPNCVGAGALPPAFQSFKVVEIFEFIETLKLLAPGPTNLCWYRRGSSRASKLVLVQARWPQAQQTCVAQARCLQGFKVAKIQSSKVFENISNLKTLKLLIPERFQDAGCKRSPRV